MGCKIGANQHGYCTKYKYTCFSTCEHWEPTEKCVCMPPFGGDVPGSGGDDTLTGTQLKIRQECNKIKWALIEKNRRYGDSAINPKRVFSHADPIEQINIRIDDKLSRIMSGQADDDEDPEFDLIGYLILKRVARQIQQEAKGSK